MSKRYINDVCPYDINIYINFAKKLGIRSYHLKDDLQLRDKITIVQFCRIINYLIDIDFDKYELYEGLNYNIEKMGGNFYNVWSIGCNDIFSLFAYKEKNGQIDSNIRYIISNPNNQITISEALLLLKLVFSFMLPEINNENIYEYVILSVQQIDKIRDMSNKLEKLNLYKILYYYVAFLFEEIGYKDIKTIYISDLIDYWNCSPINVYKFLFNICKAAPKIVNFIENKILIYIFNCSYKDKSLINDIYKKMIEIDETSSLYGTGTYEILGNDVYQYTSLNSLYKMLSKSNELDANNNANITLHMSNVAYLNDPNEGNLFSNENSKYKIYNKNNNIEVKNTYILCLSKNSEEQLPMWIQYGDSARGCRIEFVVPRNIKLYNISYCKDGNELPKVIEYLLKKYKEETNELVKKYIQDKINEVQYYYKDQYYEHEQEVRYTLNVSPQNALEYDFIREGEYFPRLYCETPYPFKIKSVMLGPKCPNPEQVALYLKRMGVPEVYKSNIKFQ